MNMIAVKVDSSVKKSDEAVMLGEGITLGMFSRSADMGLGESLMNVGKNNPAYTLKRRIKNAHVKSQMAYEKIKGINHDRLNKHLDVMVKNTGKSRAYIKWDIFRNFLTTGCSYTDYFRGDYINLTKEQKKTFVTAKKFYNIIHYFNDPEYIVLLHDKLVFDDFFEKYIKGSF